MLPASERYYSERFAAVLERAEKAARPAALLSGKFGLIAADTLILNYCHLLMQYEVATLQPLGTEQLQAF
ncbi:MAG TPA: hypothetical protein PLT04_04155 [Candidatus Saccharibacteria bacterium]|nr:hypothetical protein [Candidatus Saccharibacteria bacterium]